MAQESLSGKHTAHPTCLPASQRLFSVLPKAREVCQQLGLLTAPRLPPLPSLPGQQPLLPQLSAPSPCPTGATPGFPPWSRLGVGRCRCRVSAPALSPGTPAPALCLPNMDVVAQRFHLPLSTLPFLGKMFHTHKY